MKRIRRRVQTGIIRKEHQRVDDGWSQGEEVYYYSWLRLSYDVTGGRRFFISHPRFNFTLAIAEAVQP